MKTTKHRLTRYVFSCILAVCVLGLFFASYKRMRETPEKAVSVKNERDGAVIVVEETKKTMVNNTNDVSTSDKLMQQAPESRQKGLPAPPSNTAVSVLPSKEASAPEYKPYEGPVLSKQIMGIIGAEEGFTHSARVDAAHRLSKRLKRSEIEALYRFLFSAPSQHPDLPLDFLNDLKNEVLGSLLSQAEVPQDLGVQLVAMYQDHGLDTMWRDFCVQHFAVYYEKKKGLLEGNTQDDADIVELRKSYSDAFEEYDSSIAGTALLGIERLTRAYDEFDKVEISRKALDIAANKKAHIRSRISAIQVAGRMGNQDVLPLAKEIVNTPSSLPFQLSAIATIGFVGSRDDIQFLDNLIGNGNKYIQKAAKSAKSKLLNSGLSQ